MSTNIPEAATAAKPKAARLMFSGSVAAVIGLCAYYSFTAQVEDPIHIQIGVTILFLATLPSLLWAKNGGRNLPLFEMLMLTAVNAYAIPMLAGHEQLRKIGPENIGAAGLAVILYQVVAIAVYYSIRGRPGTTPFYTREVISHDINRYIGYGLTLTTVYTFVSVFFDPFPRDLAGVLRAVFFGIGLVSVFVQARRWGLRELSPTERTLFLLNMGIQIVILTSTLFLVGGISMLLLAFVGYIAGSRKIPVLAVLATVTVTALLHNGKAAMREVYWEASGVRRQPELTELPGFFYDWVQAGLAGEKEGSGEKKMGSKLLDRTSLFHLLCLVVSRTPEYQPYLNGDTYAQIPAQFVPRFFWPGKPLAHVSSNTLAIYYGLQREEDTAKTTVGFGTLTEAYANFGLFGLGLLGAFHGACYKKLQISAAKSPLLSYPGLMMIILMAWSFQTEYTLSIWLSSMFQAVVAIMAIPFIIRNTFG